MQCVTATLVYVRETSSTFRREILQFELMQIQRLTTSKHGLCRKVLIVALRLEHNQIAISGKQRHAQDAELWASNSVTQELLIHDVT